jgi:flagellar hook assembly protein FlgD
VINARGQVVRTFREGTRNAGEHSLSWDGRDNTGMDCSTGIYLFRLNVGEASYTRKAVLVK